MEERESGRSRIGRLSVFGIAVSIACVLALAPLVAIAPFDRPGADDFAYSAPTHEVVLDSGGIASVVGTAAEISAHAFQTWQGLYTSAFLFALQPGIFGAQWYQIGAYAMLLCIVLSSLYFSYAFSRYLLGTRGLLWVPTGLLLATCLLQGMPQVVEAVYWFNGAVNYTPWFCAAMVTSGCCITALQAEGGLHRNVMVALASVLVLAAGGANYMPSFVCIMVTFGFAVLGARRRRFALVVPFAFALAGFLVNATSPGTAIRRAMFPDHPGVISTLAHSAWQALMDVHAFADVTLLVSLLLVTPFVAMWARSGSLRFSARGLALAVALSLIALVGVNCVPFYGTGSFGEGRTYNTCYELFVVSAFVCWCYLICLVIQETRSARAGIRRLCGRLERSALFCIALAVGGVGLVVFWGGAGIEGQHGNSLLAARDLVNGAAVAYAREFDGRDASLSEAGVDDAVVVEPFENRPATLFFSDVEGQYGDDWGGAMAAYYDVADVAVADIDGDNGDAML